MTTVAAPTRERPILFSGPMVRAILDGRKTQTRRVVKPQPAEGDTVALFSNGWFAGRLRDSENALRPFACPFGHPGDRLWVREAFNHFFAGEHRSSCLYLADAGTDRWRQAPSEEDAKRTWVGWKPSIHMPRWASRLTLEITGVRVERLQEIDHLDTRAEGLGCPEHDFPSGFCSSYCHALVGAYRELWDSLNAARGYGWDVNPWVWVIGFRRVEA